MSDEAPNMTFVGGFGMMAALVVLLGGIIGVGAGIDWWNKRRIVGGECLFVVHADPESLCVVTKDFGAYISPEGWAEALRLSSPLFCGAPLLAADFAQKSGHRICQHTVIRPGAKFDPP